MELSDQARGKAAWLADHLYTIRELVEELNSEERTALYELPGPLGHQLREYLHELSGEMQRLASELRSAAEYRDPVALQGHAVEASISIQEMTSSAVAARRAIRYDLEASLARFGYTDSHTIALLKRARAWLGAKLIPQLKVALTRAWGLISRLLTPKEWKIKGEIGSTVLGLAKAELEITFG